MAERVVETRAELPFIGDHVVYVSHNQAARSGPRMTALLSQIMGLRNPSGNITW